MTRPGRTGPWEGLCSHLRPCFAGGTLGQTQGPYQVGGENLEIDKGKVKWGEPSPLRRGDSGEW